MYIYQNQLGIPPSGIDFQGVRYQSAAKKNQISNDKQVNQEKARHTLHMNRIPPPSQTDPPSWRLQRQKYKNQRQNGT